MKTLLAIITLGFLYACSNQPENKVIRTEHVEKNESSSDKVIPNRELTMEVSGMMCVMGCGSSIRKELYQTKGVSEVEFDFEEERETNVAKIKFDKNIVSIEEMVSIVNTMNENQFTVGNTTSSSLEQKSINTKEEAPSSTKEDEKEVIKTSSSLKINSFIPLLTKFLTKNIFDFKTVTL
jgi:copper chaperone CopZ